MHFESPWSQVRWETIDKFPNSRLQRLRYAKTEGNDHDMHYLFPTQTILFTNKEYERDIDDQGLFCCSQRAEFKILLAFVSIEYANFAILLPTNECFHG